MSLEINAIDSTSPQSVSPRAHSDFACKLTEAIQGLLQYCRKNDWGGYDPYDALNSRMFAKVPFSKNKLARLAFTQFMKRFPVNLRRPLLVPKQQNPKGLALFISALVKLHRLGLSDSEEVKPIVGRLLELRSAGWDRYCWGYNFSWQTRSYLVPRGAPNIICTTFAGNALLDAYDAFGNDVYLESASSAGHFLLESLHRSDGHVGSCFAYTPLDKSRIHNANLLGAAFLARLHSFNNSREFLDQALSSARFSIAFQKEDGSWPYGENARQQWIDSFHTGYNLVALRAIEPVAAELDIQSSLRKGLEFFQRHFITPEGVVKYYHNATYPIDLHAVAYAIVTLVEFKDLADKDLRAARRICQWALHNMRSDAGYFYFQKWPVGTNKIPYMRWCQAWMLLAMATLMTGIQETDLG
jgi:hypothetical protein